MLKIQASGTRSLPASVDESVPEDFLRAMTSLTAADLKRPYQLENFAPKFSLRGDKFYVGDEEISTAEIAARGIKEAQRLRPYLKDKYNANAMRVFITAAALDGKAWLMGKDKRGRAVRTYELDLSDLEIASALLALSTKREDIDAGGVLIGGGIRVSINGFTNDGAIDAMEIGKAEKGGWVDLMKYIYKTFVSIKPSAKLSGSEPFQKETLEMPASKRPEGGPITKIP
jgi:hypothetical protein